MSKRILKKLERILSIVIKIKCCMGIAPLFLSVLIFTFSCKISSANFQEKLYEIDALKNTGTVEACLSELKKLRSKARRPEQFLSIAKREYSLQGYKNACDTLIKGTEKTKDVRLIAFLSFLAIETENYEIAMPYIGELYDSAYESFAVELLFKDSNTDIKQKMDYKVLMSAFEDTKNEAFLVDAALCLIANGQLKEALALRTSKPENSSEYPLFWAELAFDTGDFSVIFDELKYTIENYDLHGLDDEEITKKTKAHILLAADGHYGLGEIEMARAHWSLYADMFSEANPLVFYNLTLTTTDVLERSSALLECVQNFPDFYPATARYARDYMAYQNEVLERKKSASMAETEIENFLMEKELYSNDMENFFLRGQFFILDPKTLLQERAIQFGDPRFQLELLRFKTMEEADFVKYTAELWQFLETHPESKMARKFAKWYFSKLGQFETVFEIEEIDDSEIDAFYTGLKASLLGESSKALKSYKAAFGELGFEYASRVNYACTKALLGESDIAIKTYTDALKYIDSSSERSKIHFRIAEILYELREYERAKSVLQYALQLDKSNYLAENLLQHISN